MEDVTVALPATAAAIFFGIYKVVQMVAKIIPDDATGAMGFIRKVAKILCVYIPNQK
jgi:hypothetical protein